MVVNYISLKLGKIWPVPSRYVPFSSRLAAEHWCQQVHFSLQRVLPNCPLINNARAVGAWQPFPLNGETWFPSHRCILPISRHFSWPEEVPGALCQCCISVSESRFASSCRGSTGQQKGMLVEENLTQRSGFFQSLQHPLVGRWTKSDEMDSVLLLVPMICSATSDPELVLVQVTQQVCTTLCCAVLSRSVVSDSLRPRGLQPARLLCPWDFPGKNTGVGCHPLLQGIFPTQRLSPGLPHCGWILYYLSHHTGL